MKNTIKICFLFIISSLIFINCETTDDSTKNIVYKTINKEWSFEGCTPSITGKWTHCYHRYPAKFIPQLVEYFLDSHLNTLRE